MCLVGLRNNRAGWLGEMLLNWELWIPVIPSTVDQLLGVNSKQLLGTVSCRHPKADQCKCWQTQREVTDSGTSIPDRHWTKRWGKDLQRVGVGMIFQRPWYCHHIFRDGNLRCFCIQASGPSLLQYPLPHLLKCHLCPRPVWNMSMISPPVWTTCCQICGKLGLRNNHGLLCTRSVLVHVERGNISWPNLDDKLRWLKYSLALLRVQKTHLSLCTVTPAGKAAFCVV